MSLDSSLDALPRWDLTTIYPSPASPAFRHDLAGFASRVSALESLFTPEDGGTLPRLTGRTDDEIATMFDRVAAGYDEAVLASWRLDSFVAAWLDIDAGQALAREAEAELQPLLARLAVIGQRFAQWIKTLDRDRLLDRSALACSLAFPLQRMSEQADHGMSSAEESLAAELDLCSARAWSRLRRDVTASMRIHLRMDTTDHLLSMGELRALMRVPVRTVRQAAFAAESAAWSANSVSLAAALNGIKGHASVLSARRGWPSPLDEALWVHGLDRQIVDALLTATREALPDFRRYLRAKARLLGVPILAWYDLEAPVGEDWSPPFVEAASLVRTAFSAYDPALGNLAARAFDERWIDATPRPGKQSGGLCYWFGDGVSRIRLEFRPGYDSVRTLAHELGHAYHAVVLTDGGCTALQIESAAPSLWETASKFCEELVRQEAVRQAEDRGDVGRSLALLDGFLTAVQRSVVEALTLFVFEDRLFARRAARALTAEELSALIVDSRAELVGDALDSSAPYPWTWAAQPQLYLADTPFYNLPYLFGQVYALSLFARYEEDPATFRRTFTEALAAIGREPAALVSARLGLDLGALDVWRAGFRIISAAIDRYEALARAPVAR